jgi:hypothetical protein
MDDERRPSGEEPASVASGMPETPPPADEPQPADVLEPAPPPPDVAPLVNWSAPPPELGPWQYDTPPGWSGLDVASVFSRTIDTFIGHWQTFVALSIPFVLVSVISIVVASTRSGAAASVRPIDLLALLYIPLGLFVTTSIAMATDDVHAGRRVSALAVLGPAVGRALVALLSAIVVWIVVVGLLVVPIVLFSVAVLAGGAGGAALGVLVLLVAGAIVFYVLFRWAFAPTAIAIDGAGPLSGLNRSWRLTKGNLWRLGVLVIGVGVITGPWSIAGSLLLLADKVAAGAVVGIVGTLLFGALGSILLTIAYGDVTGRWRASQAAAEAGAPAGEWWTALPGEAGAAEPSVTAVEPAAPVGWQPDMPAGDPAVPPPVLGAASSPPASPVEGVSRAERRVYVVGVFIVGCLLLIPSIAIAAPSLGSIGLTGIPAADRGRILAGTQRDPADPCAPHEQATTFESSDTIYVGGYFSRAILPGQSATVHVLVDDVERASAPLDARSQMVACYYEQEALTGLSPATYRILVDDSTGVLAEGSFTVR